MVGGEPLLHGERVLALIDGLADTAVRTVIVTNGTACTPRFIERLRGGNVHLVLSIDTLDPEFWQFVRGRPSFARVMANFRAGAPSPGAASAAAEDIEFCYRVNRLGYRIAHCADAVVEHDFGYDRLPPNAATPTTSRCCSTAIPITWRASRDRLKFRWRERRTAPT